MCLRCSRPAPCILCRGLSPGLGWAPRPAGTVDSRESLSGVPGALFTTQRRAVIFVVRMPHLLFPKFARLSLGQSSACLHPRWSKCMEPAPGNQPPVRRETSRPRLSRGEGQRPLPAQGEAWLFWGWWGKARRVGPEPGGTSIDLGPGVPLAVAPRIEFSGDSTGLGALAGSGSGSGFQAGASCWGWVLVAWVGEDFPAAAHTRRPAGWLCSLRGQGQ